MNFPLCELELSIFKECRCCYLALFRILQRSMDALPLRPRATGSIDLGIGSKLYGDDADNASFGSKIVANTRQIGSEPSHSCPALLTGRFKCASTDVHRYITQSPLKSMAVRPSEAAAWHKVLGTVIPRALVWNHGAAPAALVGQCRKPPTVERFLSPSHTSFTCFRFIFTFSSTAQQHGKGRTVARPLNSYSYTRTALHPQGPNPSDHSSPLPHLPPLLHRDNPVIRALQLRGAEGRGASLLLAALVAITTVTQQQLLVGYPLGEVPVFWCCLDGLVDVCDYVCSNGGGRAGGVSAALHHDMQSEGERMDRETWVCS